MYLISIICDLSYEDHDTYGVDDDPVLRIMTTIITFHPYSASLSWLFTNHYSYTFNYHYLMYLISILCDLSYEDHDTYGVDDDPVLRIMTTIITFHPYSASLSWLFTNHYSYTFNYHYLMYLISIICDLSYEDLDTYEVDDDIVLIIMITIIIFH